MATDTTRQLYSATFQESFWASLSPDLRQMLDRYEDQETWTYKSDLPQAFYRLAEQLPSVAEVPVSSSVQPITRAIIPLLANLPFRQAISALAYLDMLSAQAEPQRSIGWGVATFLEAAKIYRAGNDDTGYLDAKNLYDRLTVVVQAKIACTLFTNGILMQRELSESSNG